MVPGKVDGLKRVGVVGGDFTDFGRRLFSYISPATRNIIPGVVGEDCRDRMADRLPRFYM